jgi:4-hydroxy-tetrahydrodipicolinate synthase
MNKFGNVLIPLVTPFDEKEEVNYSVFEGLIDYVIERDFCDTIIITGTTGEFNTLTFNERAKLFEVAVKAVNGRKPVIAGTGCGSTRETIELTRVAQSIGVDACMLVAPFYCKPTQEAIYEHYRKIADNVDIGLLLYNIPIFAGVNIEPDTLRKLAKDKKIFGIKDEAGMNPVQVTDYYFAVKDINPDFLIFNGDDLMLMPTLAQGAVGIVSGTSQLVGDRVKLVFEKYYEGKNVEALEIYRQMFRLFKIFGINGRMHINPMLRAAIEIVTGIKVGKARMPLDAPNKDEIEALKKVLSETGLI